MLDEGFRLRYHQGFEMAARVERGKVYPITVDLWSTALVLNKGHKIALHVSAATRHGLKRKAMRGSR